MTIILVAPIHTHTVVWIRVEHWAYRRPQLVMAEELVTLPRQHQWYWYSLHRLHYLNTNLTLTTTLTHHFEISFHCRKFHIHIPVSPGITNSTLY